MEQGQGSGEGNTTYLSPEHQPDVTAEDVADSEMPLPRHRAPPPRTNAYRRRHVEVDEEYNEEDEEMIGSWNEPGVRTVITGVPTPDIHNPNFKINNRLLNAVQNSRFNGLPSENPLDHIDMFERACSMYKLNGVSMDTTGMMFFPFSLVALARKWERSTPSQLLSNWNDIKKEFLRAFFPRHRTEKIRADIASFRQGNAEQFSKAWARFQDFIQDYPHHGYGKGALLGMFYNGCRQRDRELLDSSSGGSFLENTVCKGEAIITKIVKNGDSEDRDYERERLPRNDASGIHEIRRKMEELHLPRATRKEVHFLDEDEEHYEDELEVSYMDNNQGY